MNSWKAITSKKPSSVAEKRRYPVLITNNDLARNLNSNNDRFTNMNLFLPTEEQSGIPFKDSQLPHYIVPVLYVPKRIVTQQELANTVPYKKTPDIKAASVPPRKLNTQSLSESESKLFTILTKKLYGVQVSESDYGDYTNYSQKAKCLENPKNITKENYITRMKKANNRIKGVLQDVIQKYNNPDYHSDSDTNFSAKSLSEAKKSKGKSVSDTTKRHPKKKNLSKEQIIYSTDFTPETKNLNCDSEGNKIPISTQTLKNRITKRLLPKQPSKDEITLLVQQKLREKSQQKKNRALPPDKKMDFKQPPQINYLMSPKLRTHSANDTQNNLKAYPL